MMDNIIKYYIKNVYGNQTMYPANETARLLCSLAGTKTITTYVETHIKKLGYELVLVHEHESELGKLTKLNVEIKRS